MEKPNVGLRVKTVRLRTWVLTGVLVIGLLLYLLIDIGFGKTINLVDFIIMVVIQSVAHCAYYPDGNLFGAKNPTYIENKTAYNNKANIINENKQVGKLRDFCQYDYEERKLLWFRTYLGTLGLTESEYDILRKLTKEELKKLKSFEIDGKLIIFSKWKRKRLIKLICGKCPVVPNNAETIMSATECNQVKALKDTSLSYKVRFYLYKAFKIFVWGGFLAYLVYTTKESFGLAEVVKMVAFLSSLVITAIFSYSAGETEIKVHKNKYYVDLSNFIDRFNEWNN